MACKYQYNNQWYSKEELVSKLAQENSNFKTLYQNLVNEITNTETGRKILDRIKRDYKYKDAGYTQQEQEIANKVIETYKKLGKTPTEKELRISQNKRLEYTLEEQQEEAIVELMSLMAADKLNKITDKNLISLLKQLLKQINDFIKSLLNTKELNINDIEVDNTKFLIENKLKELIKNGIIKKEC